MVSSVWPKTKMRLEQIGLELSLDNEQPLIQQQQQQQHQHQSQQRPIQIASNNPALAVCGSSTANTADSTSSNNTTSSASSSSYVPTRANLNFSLTLDTSSRRAGFANDCAKTYKSPIGTPSQRSTGHATTPKTLANNNAMITPIGPGTMSTRINSEFKKNVFFAKPDEEPITTNLPPEEVFEELDILGSGSSGSVLKMRHKPTGKICAVKQMRRTFNDEENKRIYMDLQVVLQCESDDIVRCCGYFIKESEVWICMELMTTCFDKVLRTRKRELPERFLGAIAVSAVRALCYLKDKHNIIHRDVKPSNILINESGHIKMCDFGISGRLIDSLARTRAAGCVPYMAPERIDFGNHSYDIRADVWSLGITLYELATGKSPYAGCQTDFDILVKVVKDDPPTLPADMDFSDEFRSFIKACLTKNCKQRPKYRQLSQHEFIVKHLKTVVSLSELDTVQ